MTFFRAVFPINSQLSLNLKDKKQMERSKN